MKTSKYNDKQNLNFEAKHKVYVSQEKTQITTLTKIKNYFTNNQKLLLIN